MGHPRQRIVSFSVAQLVVVALGKSEGVRSSPVTGKLHLVVTERGYVRYITSQWCRDPDLTRLASANRRSEFQRGECNRCESVKLTPQVCNGPPASTNSQLFFGVVGSGRAWQVGGCAFEPSDLRTTRCRDGAWLRSLYIVTQCYSYWKKSNMTLNLRLSIHIPFQQLLNSSLHYKYWHEDHFKQSQDHRWEYHSLDSAVSQHKYLMLCQF